MNSPMAASSSEILVPNFFTSSACTDGGCSCAVGASSNWVEAHRYAVRTPPAGTRMRVGSDGEKPHVDICSGFTCRSLPLGLALHNARLTLFRGCELLCLGKHVANTTTASTELGEWYMKNQSIGWQGGSKTIRHNAVGTHLSSRLAGRRGIVPSFTISPVKDTQVN